MLRALARAFVGKMERDWNYDATYMRDLIAASPWTFAKFAVVTMLVGRRDAPGEALAAAGIVGTVAEDCGPCTQISVDMAARGGVPAPVLRAILAGDRAGMGQAASLSYDFAREVLEKRLEEADALRDEIVRRWGMKGLTAISLALTTARMYPTLKYALGHGKTCSKVSVAGEPMPVAKPLPLAA